MTEPRPIRDEPLLRDESVRVPETPQPIFILGAPAARHALVGAMLGRHPSCFGTPELNLFVGDSIEDLSFKLAEPHNAQLHGLLRAVAHLFAGEQTMDSVEMARRWLMRRLSLPSWHLFEEVRAKVAPLRLVDPSRSYSAKPEAIANILRVYPDAGFVHVVGAPEQPGEAARPERPMQAQRARKAALAFTEALARLDGRLAVVDLDELLAGPERVLPGLCEALGLSRDADAMERMLHPERSPFAGFGPVGANLGSDPAFLAAPGFPHAVAERPAG